MSYLVDEEVILASGARTATQTLGPYKSPDQFGTVDAIEVILDLTAFTTAASLTLSVEGYVEGSSAFRTILSGAALTAVGVTRLVLGPMVPAAANASATAILPKQLRVVVTHGNANSHTYSVTVRRLRRS